MSCSALRSIVRTSLDCSIVSVTFIFFIVVEFVSRGRLGLGGVSGFAPLYESCCLHTLRNTDSVLTHST